MNSQEVDTKRRGLVFFTSKAELRQQVQADIDVFLRSGGIIHRYPPGRAQGLTGISIKRLEVIRGIWQQAG